MGKKVEEPLHHRKPGLEPTTTTDQGGVNAPSMGIELATNGQVVVALASWAMAIIVEKHEMSVYMRT